MRLDLHVHSTASDGQFDPAEVVRHAVLGRLDVIALTDHDTTGGVKTAVEAARGHHLDVISATEMSSTDSGREIHVLGYFLDPEAPELARREQRAEDRRLERLSEMVVRLQGQGLEIDMAAVLSTPGADVGNIGRPHLARALVAAGHAANLEDAFERWIGNDCPAFIPTALSTPVEVVELIREVGGVAVWAHPPRDALERLTTPLVDAGLQGLEVYRPNHGSRYAGELGAVARSHGLVVTGGSDWHGEQNGALGDFYVSGDEVEDFLTLGGL